MRLPYNINVLSQAAVQYVLEHAPILEDQSQSIRRERTRLTQGLRERGFEVWPSEANFVVMGCRADQARPLFDALKKHRILVKCLDGSHPRLKDTLRVTVGAPKETDALFAALDHLAAEFGR
jgi:histidinol-phosphate aminotransferase